MKWRNVFRTAAFAAAGSALPAAAEPPGPGGVPAGDAGALMGRVAAVYARATRGTIGVRSSSVLTIEAPLFHKRIARDSWFVFADGVLVRSDTPLDPRRPPLHDPYDPRYVGEYRFTFAPCPACAPGAVAVTYDARAHDRAHASGTLTVDEATARIVRDTERPYALPWPTREGALEATWGGDETGWFPLTIAGDFVGRIGPFTGRAHYAQTLSHYARFADAEAAVAALDGRAGAPASAPTDAP